MPNAPLRPCTEVGCPALVARGRCEVHARQREARRRQYRTLTYGEGWWRAWRLQFVATLVSLGVEPICGATMPDGPSSNPSLCRQQGLKTFVSNRGDLHLHHEPELSPEEQRDRQAVCQASRIVLLCGDCHRRVTPTLSRW